MNLLFPIILFTLFVQAQTPPKENDGDKPVKIEKIVTEGSRFQQRSILALSGLRAGQQVTEATVRKAITNVLNSGLIDNVDYTYESLSETNSIILTLKLRDTGPLLPASIKIPGIDAEDAWKYLQNIDPVFTRDLPRTQNALKFYCSYLERYLKTLNRDEAISSEVVADSKGTVNSIVFSATKYRELSKPTSKKKR